MSQFQFSEYMLLRRSDVHAAEEMLANATEEDQRLCRALGDMERSAAAPPRAPGLPLRTLLLVFAPAILAAGVAVPLWIAGVPSLRSDLAQSKREVVALRKVVARSSAEAATLREQLDRSAAEIRTLRHDLAAVRAERDRLVAAQQDLVLRVERVVFRGRAPQARLDLPLLVSMRIGETLVRREGWVSLMPTGEGTWEGTSEVAWELPAFVRQVSKIDIEVQAGDYAFRALEMPSVERLLTGDSSLVSFEDPLRQARLELLLRLGP